MKNTYNVNTDRMTKKTIRIPLLLAGLLALLLPCSLSANPPKPRPPAHTPSQDSAALPYFQQELHYNISVTLDDRQHSLNAFETIEYKNNSPDSLNFIWFHCWPNAYKDQTTALYRQLTRLGKRKDKLKKIKDNGYVDHLDFKIDGITALTQPHPQYSDILKVLLPSPLAPGKRMTITTPFFVKIPSYFSRLGHEDQSYMITQWYPKPAVYDRKGWHEMPYLDQGEFFSEYGSFDVHITLPSAYTVAATGTLKTGSEKDSYEALGRKNLAGDSSGAFLYEASDPNAAKTLDYHGENIHDFAWFADKNLIIQYDTLRLPSGKIIDVFSYHRINGDKQWAHSISYIKDAVLHYSKWVGEYRYPVVSAVEGPGNNSSGGMEYPTITLITSPRAGREELDGVIAHEVGHNWFYGMLGSNEREHPWMDEGMNTYYEFLYEAEKYRANTMLGSMIPPEIRKKNTDDFLNAIYGVFNQLKTIEPIETPATGFDTEFDYGVVEYAKAAVWMYILKKTLGAEEFEKGMHTYFSDWVFKHPYPEDLKNSLEKASGTNLDKAFELLNKNGPFYVPGFF